MTIRPVTPADAQKVGEVVYSAFNSIAERHNFPPDFPSAEAAMGIAGMCVGSPAMTGFVAEGEDGEFLGSNFLWTQNSIYGVGPITVSPDAHAKGVGCSLMQAVIQAGKGAPSIGRVQDAR